MAERLVMLEVMLDELALEAQAALSVAPVLGWQTSKLILRRTGEQTD